MLRPDLRVDAKFHGIAAPVALDVVRRDVAHHHVVMHAHLDEERRAVVRDAEPAAAIRRVRDRPLPCPRVRDGVDRQRGPRRSRVVRADRERLGDVPDAQRRHRMQPRRGPQDGTLDGRRRGQLGIGGETLRRRDQHAHAVLGGRGEAHVHALEVELPTRRRREIHHRVHAVGGRVEGAEEDVVHLTGDDRHVRRELRCRVLDPLLLHPPAVALDRGTRHEGQLEPALGHAVARREHPQRRRVRDGQAAHEIGLVGREGDDALHQRQVLRTAEPRRVAEVPERLRPVVGQRFARDLRRRAAVGQRPVHGDGRAGPGRAAEIELPRLPRPQSFVRDLLREDLRIRREVEGFDRQQARRLMVAVLPGGRRRVHRDDDFRPQRAEEPHQAAQRLLVAPLLQRDRQALRVGEIRLAKEVAVPHAQLGEAVP